MHKAYLLLGLHYKMSATRNVIEQSCIHAHNYEVTRWAVILT